MKTAPRDGFTDIEVKHGRDQEIVVAHYAGQLQGFTRSDDPLRRVLHMVTGWCPILPNGQMGASSTSIRKDSRWRYAI